MFAVPIPAGMRMPAKRVAEATRRARSTGRSVSIDVGPEALASLGVFLSTHARTHRQTHRRARARAHTHPQTSSISHLSFARARARSLSLSLCARNARPRASSCVHAGPSTRAPACMCACICVPVFSQHPRTHLPTLTHSHTLDHARLLKSRVYNNLTSENILGH